MTRWEEATRAWATHTGRQLALDLYHQIATGVRPYDVGLVPWHGEKLWAQIPGRCSQDTPTPLAQGSQPRSALWLITSHRVAGRAWTDTLRWEWATVIGLRVDLDPGHETVQLDFPGAHAPATWAGPGVAPMAVAAIYHIHGAAALTDHPGLASLRSSWDVSKRHRNERSRARTELYPASRGL